MKIKMLLLSLLAIAQVASAARLEVANETGCPVQVMVYYGNRSEGSDTQTIANGRSVTFNSGVHAFTHIKWHTSNCNAQNQWGAATYMADIPSSRTMLQGSIVLRQGNHFGLNFDADGSSHNKVREAIAHRAQ